jgi:CHAT domain-containing protein/tetratricopeptide (TPR) repeat protein
MALDAGDEALAHSYASLTLSETARELESIGTRHCSEAERIEREGRGAPDAAALERVRMLLADMYTYAVGFVPFVHGQTLVSLLEAGRGRDPDQVAAAKFVVDVIRPRLDAAGWTTWPYDAATVRKAAFWSAYAFTHLGQLWLDNADTGRDVEDAERLADGALALIPDDAQSHLHADALSLKARILARYGLMQIDRAIACAERSLEMLKALPDDVAAAAERVNAGAYYKMKSDLAAANDDAQAAALLDVAERYFREAVDAYRAHDPYGRLAGALTNLGIVYTDRQRWDEAYATLMEADAALPQARYNFEIRARIANNIGALLNDRKRFAEAMTWFDKALAAKPTDGTVTIDPEVEIMAHGGLGVAILRTAGATAAEPHLLRAIEAVEAYRRSFFSERANAALLLRFRWVYEAYIDCCATLGERDPAHRGRAFETAEELKWRAMTTLLRYRRLSMVDEREEPLVSEERRLLAFLTGRLLGDPSAVRRDAAVVAAMQRLEQIWTDLAPRHPEYVAIRREETVDAQGAARALDEHVSSLVEYYLGDEYGTSLAFVLRRGETTPEIVRLPADAERVTRLVAELRRQTTRVPVAAFREASHALYEAVLEPVLHLVPENEGVCIVPYGQLHNAPFAGLWDGERYLFERNPLAIAASASALRWWIGKDRGRRERCLVFSATSGIREGSERLVDLALFEDLARRRIAPLFPTSTVIAGAEATKERLLRALSAGDGDAPDVVHIACHGIARPQGFDSCLVMAAPRDAREKDLTALEVAAGLRLETTLVTLSACDSAVSESSTGDNVAGLCPSFLQAGASTVLATLWEIRQDAAVSFMRTFYDHWSGRRGAAQTKLAALHSALRDVSREKGWLGRLRGFLGLGDDFSHPYLWSTFQLYGNWR